jgi:hypothetical protein
MERRDALFVINQDASLADLKTVCQAEDIRSALILTTHRLFSHEQEMLSQIVAYVKIISFADLLSETDMCHCDAMAEHVLFSERRSGTVDYISRFMALSLIEKNRIAYERLSNLYQFRMVYYVPGLGVAASYWENVGVLLHNLDQASKIKRGIKIIVPRKLKPLFSAAGEVKRFLKPDAREIYVIREDGTTYIFLSALKRLRIHPDVLVETVKLQQRSKKTSREQIVQLLTNLKNSVNSSINHRSGNKITFCMTIHGYDRALAKELGGVMVFVDGYHPSNYPRSYLENYRNDDVFVARTMFDEHWFTIYGKRTIKPPAFMEREYFAPCAACSGSRVLVALNHAGDWTALINRSDTDDLVAAAAEMARRLPHILFRIRTHPTMNHPAHEGLHSSERIELFVRSVNLANLHISTQNLAADIAWCDVCLSEYSQVLLDAMRIGKLGVAVNLTKRRSLMQDYDDIGFFHARNLVQAISILQYIVDDRISACYQQNLAVDRYNAMLTEWLGEQRSFSMEASRNSARLKP